MTEETSPSVETPAGDTSATPTASVPSFDGGQASSDDIAAVWSQLESGADAAPSPAFPVPADSPVAAPTAPPAETTGIVASDPGPIPFHRHKDVLDKARAEEFTRGRAEAEQQVRQQYAWAERLDPTQVQQGLNLYQWLQTDPAGFQVWLSHQIDQKAPGASTRQDRSDEPDLRAEDGTAVYSADRLRQLLARQREDLLREVTQKYDPLRQESEYQKLQQKVNAEVVSTIAHARTHWPLFTELEGDVKRTMMQQPALSFHDAYLAVFSHKGLSLHEQRIRDHGTRVVTDKLAATSTRPGPVPSTPVSYKNMDTRDIVMHEFARLEGGGR